MIRNDGKKGKGLDKEHVRMIQGRGQVWELTSGVGGERGGGGQRGKTGATVIE